MPIRARVRGIYSTAISKILHDNGIELVDVSPVIAERLGIDERRGKPADVTVKSDENNPSQILILGFPGEVHTISSIIENTVPDIIVYRPKIGLYAAFKARIIGQEGRECIAETPVGPATLVDEPECVAGREIPVTVVKVPIRPGERMVVSSRVRVVGKYAIVGKGSGVSFSNFIRNKERISNLLEASAQYVRQGFSIRWRSNADEANLEEVVNEIPQLISKLREVEHRLAYAKPLEVVYIGEFMRLVELTYNSKAYLDAVRNEVAPTAPYHHMLRSDEIRSNGLVDLLDIIAAEVEGSRLATLVRKWIAHRLSNKRDIILLHKRITKKNIVLGKAKPVEVIDGKGISVIVKRSVKSAGEYDGLNIPKEPGDQILTYMTEGSWITEHRYFDKDGNLKGVYVNVNTPPEFLPSGQVQYVDLEVDLVRASGEPCRIIDSKLFLALVRGGYVQGDIYVKVLKAVDEAISKYCVKDALVKLAEQTKL